MGNTPSSSIDDNDRPGLYTSLLHHSRPCPCTALHRNCDRQTCPKAATQESSHRPEDEDPENRNVGLDVFRRAARAGCPVCSAIYAGVREFLHSDTAAYLRRDGRPPEREVELRITDDISPVELFKWRRYTQIDLEFCTTYDHVFVKKCRAFITVRGLSNPISPDQRYGDIFFWIDNCKRNHPNCPPFSKSPLPKRVIDVGKDDNGIPFLYEPRGKIADYITLSHRWGTSQIFTTTRANLESGKRGIPLSSLSKTFRDAIGLTRKLGVQYLWIDSLCIVQDDRKEWETEAAKMGAIYQNAYLTIAACASSSEIHGLFYDTRSVFTRDALPIPPMYSGMPGIFVRRAMFHDFARTNHLQQRGWTMQEALFSPRILHYTDAEVVFECPTTQQCQCAFLDRATGRSSNNGFWNALDVLKKSAFLQSNSPLEGGDAARVWGAIVSNYSTRRLTYDTDRFPAISALARRFESRESGAYCAGLWMNWLPWMMAWKPRSYKGRRATAYIAPSWSWASIICDVWFPLSQSDMGKRITKVRILRMECIPSGSDPYGQLSGGAMVVSGPSIEVRLSKWREDGYSETHPVYQLVHPKDGSLCLFNPDGAVLEPRTDIPVQVVRCILWSVLPTEHQTQDTVFCDFAMVLSRSIRVSGAYERAGFVMLGLNSKAEDRLQAAKEAGKPEFKVGTVSRWFDGAEKRDITIV